MSSLRSITDPIYIGSSQIIVVQLDSTVRWTLASSSRKARVGTVVDGLVFRPRSMCVFELNTLTHIATPDTGAGMRGVQDDD